MIDHISFPVSNASRSKQFYDALLRTLDFGPVMTVEEGGFAHFAYGPGNKPIFWIGGPSAAGAPVTPLAGQHVAFAASNRAQVDAFHRAGLEAGGTDNGAPGLRPDYHPDYYAAFVIDPDGHHLEAVCHKPG